MKPDVKGRNLVLDNYTAAILPDPFSAFIVGGVIDYSFIYGPGETAVKAALEVCAPHADRWRAGMVFKGLHNMPWIFSEAGRILRFASAKTPFPFTPNHDR